jgi:nuclear pore complex protein Nup50
MEWVNTHVDRNPYIYLSPVFKDYEKHLADLKLKFKIQNNNGAIASTGFAAASDTTKPVSKPAETGFKFGNVSASSAASASVVPTALSFSFGSETSKKNDFSFGSGKSSGSEPAKAGFVFGSSGSTFGSGPSPFG